MGLKDTLTDGLPSDFEGKIVDVAFIHDAKYNAAILLSAVTIQDLATGSEHTERYSFGPNWTSVGGVSARHSSGKNAVNRQSQWGEFCNRVAAIVPDEIGSSLSSVEANSWVGYTFYWERDSQVKSFQDRETGEMITRTVSRLYPTKYLSEATASSLAATPSEVLSILSGGGYTVSVPATLAAQVQAAAQSTDFEKFGSVVLGIKGAMEHSDLTTAVFDQDFYSALRS